MINCDYPLSSRKSLQQSNKTKVNDKCIDALLVHSLGYADFLSSVYECSSCRKFIGDEPTIKGRKRGDVLNSKLCTSLRLLARLYVRVNSLKPICGNFKMFSCVTAFY